MQICLRLSESKKIFLSTFLRSESEIEMLRDREQEVKFVKISREFLRAEFFARNYDDNDRDKDNDRRVQ